MNSKEAHKADVIRWGHVIIKKKKALVLEAVWRPKDCHWMSESGQVRYVGSIFSPMKWGYRVRLVVSSFSDWDSKKYTLHWDYLSIKNTEKVHGT